MLNSRRWRALGGRSEVGWGPIRDLTSICSITSQSEAETTMLQCLSWLIVTNVLLYVFWLHFVFILFYSKKKTEGDEEL